MKKLLILILLLLLLISAGAYMASQGVKFWWGAERTGFCLLKGGYRSWYVSFCDGYTPVYRLSTLSTPGKYKWKPVSLNRDGTVQRHGYRWPRFHHADMREIRR